MNQTIRINTCCLLFVGVVSQMKVKIIYYPPFDSVTGQHSEEIEVESSSIVVSDLLRIVLAKHPEMKSYVLMSSDEELRAQMSIIAGPNLLKTTDTIDEAVLSEIKILPPVAGG
jgi:molybdopterin converting factor small subunit